MPENYQLRDTPKRIKLMRNVEELATKLGTTIELDLKTYRCVELRFMFIWLQLHEVRKEAECETNR